MSARPPVRPYRNASRVTGPPMMGQERGKRNRTIVPACEVSIVNGMVSSHMYAPKRTNALQLRATGFRLPSAAYVMPTAMRIRLR